MPAARPLNDFIGRLVLLKQDIHLYNADHSKEKLFRQGTILKCIGASTYRANELRVSEKLHVDIPNELPWYHQPMNEVQARIDSLWDTNPLCVECVF